MLKKFPIYIQLDSMDCGPTCLRIIAKYYGKYVRIIQVINYAKYFRINFIRNVKAYYADSRDKTLFYSIHRLNHFPINFKITKYDWRIYTKSKKEKVKPQT